MKFECTEEEIGVIGKIVKRVNNLVVLEPMDIFMDLEVCHSNGTPLDFDRLLAFDDVSLMHDINGIAQHIDRTTGELQNCFLPRCAK